MPTTLHDTIVDVLRRHPELLAELLARALGAPLPVFARVRLRPASFLQLVRPERSADLAVVLEDEDGNPVLAILGEVQLGDDPKKDLTWPLYAVTLRAEIGCPVIVLVVCVDDALARRCAQPIDLGFGSVFRPVVVGPSGIPVVRDPDEATGAPYRAALSALAHPTDVRAAVAGLVGALSLPAERCHVLYDMIWNVLDAATSAEVDAIMNTDDYIRKARTFKEILEIGEAKGKAEGKVEGKAEAVLAVLAARGLPVPDTLAARIRGTADLETLDRWLRRAVTCARPEDAIDA